MLRFVWDPTKADANLRKHGVGFALAARVFADPDALSVQDRIEGGERRWQTLGRVGDVLILLVAHTVIDGEAGEDDIIRIISARRAEKHERRRYDQARHGNV